MPRYKLMVQVLLAENKGSGLRVASRCLWDANTDSSAEVTYITDNLICCVIVFGVYIY